jgi:arylsulfatase A-like enzyme
MLRQAEWKYVYHAAMDKEHPGSAELYNLTADPGEFKNLAAEPAHKARRDTLHAALLKELGEHPDETEMRCRAEFARGYGRPEAPSEGKKQQKKRKNDGE